jgi:hypothetical protein
VADKSVYTTPLSAKLDELRALIAKPEKVTRREVAKVYAEALTEWRKVGGDVVIHDINNAILARWSIAGLEFIKAAAWKLSNIEIKRIILAKAEGK